MDLDKLKLTISDYQYQEDWLSLSTLLGATSHKIQTNQQIDNEICMLLYFLISIANKYEINLQTAWTKWKKKAYQKVYYSSSIK